MEPIPEGHWQINNFLYPGNKGNFRIGGWHGNINEVIISLSYLRPGKTERGAVGIYKDDNYKISPDLANNISIYNETDCEKIVSWLRDKKLQDLYVDWKLGTCTKPLPTLT